MMCQLTSRWLCAMVKSKAADYFSPFQLRVDCPGGAEAMIHSLQSCVDSHWNDHDFVVLKVDLHNAFNNVSRQAVLDQCHSHFPELLPWVLWCYSHPTNLWHPMDNLSSTSGVHQGDSLGSIIFSLFIHPVIIGIENACECLFINKWYWMMVLWLGPRLQHQSGSIYPFSGDGTMTARAAMAAPLLYRRLLIHDPISKLLDT